MNKNVRALNVPVVCITENEFKSMELEDVNYSGILFMFEGKYRDTVDEKLLKDWKLGKSHRIEQVRRDRMFYVENCDIQTVDTLMMLFSRLYDRDEWKKIYIIGDIEENDIELGG